MTFSNRDRCCVKLKEMSRKSQEFQLQIEDKDTSNKASAEKRSKEFEKKISSLKEKHEQKLRNLQEKHDLKLEEERMRKEKEMEKQASDHLREKESYIADCDQKLSEMNAAKDQESQKLKETMSDLDDLKASKEELNKQLKKSLSERQSIKRALDVANAENLKNKARGDQLQSDADNKHTRIMQLEEELGQKQQMADSQIRVLEERIASLEQENVELQSALRLERENDVENLNKEWQRKLDKANADCTQKKGQITKLEAEKTRREGAVKKLEDQVSSLESRLSKAQADLKSGASSTESQAKKLEKAISAKDKEIKTAQASVKTKTRELNDLTQKLEDRDIQIQQLKSQLTQGWTASQVRSKEMEELESKVNAIQQEYERYKLDAEKELKMATDQRNSNIESGNQSLRDEYDEKVKMIDEKYKREQASHREAKERHSSVLKERDAAISKLEKIVEASNAKEKELRHKATSADKKYAQVQAENESMKEELYRLRTKAEMIQARAETAIEEISNPIATDGRDKKNEQDENKENREPRRGHALIRKRTDMSETTTDKDQPTALDDEAANAKRAKPGRSCIRRNSRRKPLAANTDRIGKPNAASQSPSLLSDLFEA